MKDVIVGIDLGTTNSLIAYCDERGPRIIQSPQGTRILPSVVHIDPVTGKSTVGDEPRRRAVERPRETVHSIKRLMGRGLRDSEVERGFLPYELVAMSPTGDVAGVQVGSERRTPQQISAVILTELRRWAEAHFGHEVRKAVVTVPAYFDDAQRQATKDAGAIAGLDVVRIVNEPTAAALAYGLDRVREGTVAIYDLGGGTFDISILEIQDGVFSVLATNGDTHLGGDDFDRAIISLVQGEIRDQFGQDIDFDPATRQALRAFAEAVKVELSEKAGATIEIELGEGRTYRRQISREEFLAMIEPLIARTLQRCEACLRDSRRERKDIDRVVMVGGSTYMPAIRDRVGKFFEADVYTALNPMEVVALGASVQASILAGVNRELLLRDIVPLSLGIETMGGAVAKIIHRGSAIPCKAQELFSTYTDGQTNVKVHVLQGERELVQDCRSLGTVILSEIPPMPAGIPKVRVSFFVDANGILLVKAREERSGTEASIQVVPSYGLARAEVDAMIRESVEHARADMHAHRLIDLRNQITLDIAAIEKSMRIVGDELDPAYRQELTELIATLRKLAESDDADRIHGALRSLDSRSARLGELAIARTLREST